MLSCGDRPVKATSPVSGRSAWFVGALVLVVYAILALSLYLLPPAEEVAARASMAIALG